MSRGIKALAAVAVVVLAVVFAVRAFGGDDEPAAGPSSEASDTPAGVPTAPADTPAEGMYVVSTVADDGTVDVQTWVRSATPVESLELTTTDPDLAPGGVESLDVVVRTMDDKVLARRDSVGTNTQTLAFRRPATEFYFHYTVDGGLSDASETVQGRQLVRVLGMDVDYAGAGGTVHRVVEGPGTVINVACIQRKDDEDFNASPRPCGASTDDGGWEVDLTGANRGDRLLAQLEQ